MLLLPLAAIISAFILFSPSPIHLLSPSGLELIILNLPLNSQHLVAGIGYSLFVKIPFNFEQISL